jgi:integrase
MAAIQVIKLKNGETRYRAQIRIMREKKAVYSESKTFAKKRDAQNWARDRESEIDTKGLPGNESGMTVAAGCERWLSDLERTRKGAGRSRAMSLRRMAQDPMLQKLKLEQARSNHWLDYIESRRQVVRDGVVFERQPATLNEDLVYIRGLVQHAVIAWGMNASIDETLKATLLLQKMGTVAKSRERIVRPELEQLDEILKWFYRDVFALRAQYSPNEYVRQILFLIFSTRRLSEVDRLRWDDLDRENNRILVRDLKHPRKKIGNDKWMHLTPRAMALIDLQPKEGEFIWRVEGRTLSAYFQRARAWAYKEQPDLRIHDLRHEGVSHLFELGWDIPRVEMVSLHGSWQNLKRYTHLSKSEPHDKYAGWSWLDKMGVA